MRVLAFGLGVGFGLGAVALASTSMPQAIGLMVVSTILVVGSTWRNR